LTFADAVIKDYWRMWGKQKKEKLLLASFS